MSMYSILPYMVFSYHTEPTLYTRSYMDHIGKKPCITDWPCIFFLQCTTENLGAIKTDKD